MAVRGESTGGRCPDAERSAGAGRPGILRPWPGVAVTASSAQAACSGSPHLKNEWLRLGRYASRDPGHSLLTRERRPARDGGSGHLVWPSAGGRFPPPRPPPCRIGRLSCPLTPAGVPVMFRRSSGSSPNSKRSVEQLRCSERCTSPGERTFDPSHRGGHLELHRAKARHDLLHNQPEEPDRARPSAVPAARRPAGGSAPPSSAGGHQASLGTAACLPWPSATRSWATRAGCRRPRRSGGSYGCRLRCCCWVGLPRRIPFVGAGSDAAPELGLDQGSSGHGRGCAAATC